MCFIMLLQLTFLFPWGMTNKFLDKTFIFNWNSLTTAISSPRLVWVSSEFLWHWCQSVLKLSQVKFVYLCKVNGPHGDWLTWSGLNMTRLRRKPSENKSGSFIHLHGVNNGYCSFLWIAGKKGHGSCLDEPMCFS